MERKKIKKLCHCVSKFVVILLTPCLKHLATIVFRTRNAISMSLLFMFPHQQYLSNSYIA